MNQTLPDRIFICGFMGAGKSTIGEALAEKMDLPFYDLDAFIEEQAGRSIPDIFKLEGEKKFRQHERSALLEIIRKRKGIIALGGGTLQNQHLVDHIKVNGTLVFIKASMETILQRVMRHENRPMLWNDKGEMKSKKKLRKDLKVLYNQRLPLYEQAEITINCEDFSSVEALTDQLFKKIRYHVAFN